MKRYFLSMAMISLFMGSAWGAENVINIPLKTWIRLDVPDISNGIQQTKHVSWAWNPVDKRLYSMGGDFDASGISAQSYNQAQYSLSIYERFTNRANKNAGWRLEMAYCAADAGGIQPKSPDFVGWTFDSTRNVFWFIPGTSVIPVYAECAGRTASTSDDAHYKFAHVMTFDPTKPTASRWTDITANKPPNVTPPEQWKTFYDKQTDSFIKLTRSVSGNAVAEHITATNLLAGNAWTAYDQGTDSSGRTIYWEKEGAAFDPVGRVIYTGDGTYGGRFFKYNVDTHTKTHIGALPAGAANAANPDNDENFAWDSANNVLLYFGGGNQQLYAYHPTTNTWETLPMTMESPGQLPAVRHAFVYDPGQNVLALLGNNIDPYTNPYIYLYRYGNGSGTIDTKIPAAPTGLTVR